MKILIIDNYDSFTYNLYHMIEAVISNKWSLKVKRNDEININEIALFDKIVISPGPGLPKDAGITCETIAKYGQTKSILGVCLGHQAIGEVYRGKLKNLEQVIHGMAIDTYIIAKDNLFANCPESFETARYHSWVIDERDFPQCLEIIAKDKLGLIAAIRHKYYPVKGVQFHPESILNQYGKQILKNWVNDITL
ncbi:MAG: aminodeoxychorismate/anthranilate synthase component II [Bacteroidetes bacterium]|nr:aminodeoxychorismate/anthranilate synthase component II [Bacteroidota bacterium]